MDQKLYKKMQDIFNETKLQESPFFTGARYVATKDYPDDENKDATPDFPYIVDPKGFVTNRPLEQNTIEEQDKEKVPLSPEKAGAEADADIKAPELPSDPAAGGEGGIGDMGMDAQGAMPGVAGAGADQLGGMGQQPEPLTSSQLGRVYELKKIYSRLTSVETFLSQTTDEKMQQVRKSVAQAIDLFELVISNYTQYMDKIDEIIVTYYEFLNSVFSLLKDYFSDTSKE